MKERGKKLKFLIAVGILSIGVFAVNWFQNSRANEGFFVGQFPDLNSGSIVFFNCFHDSCVFFLSSYEYDTLIASVVLNGEIKISDFERIISLDPESKGYDKTAFGNHYFYNLPHGISPEYLVFLRLTEKVEKKDVVLYTFESWHRNKPHVFTLEIPLDRSDGASSSLTLDYIAI